MRDRKRRDIIASQLKRAFAADAWLSILRKGSKAVSLLENAQEKTGRSERIKAAKVLVVLAKAADDQLDTIISAGDEGRFNTVL